MLNRWLTLLTILCLSLLPTRVGAQSRVKLESISVALWAEFDQPSMLVVNEFVVSQQTALPAKVTLRFPSNGNLIAVAYEANGQLVNTSFESPIVEGDWQTIALNVEAYAPYRIEYYQPLERDGNKRSFYFHWFGDYPAETFNLQLQLPADSLNVSASPALDASQRSSDGKYLLGTASKSNLKMGQSYQFKIEYERDSEALTDSSAASQVQPSAPIDENTPGRVSVDQIPWIIGLVGLAMIAFALFFYWRSLRGTSAPSASSGRRRSRSSAGMADSSHAAYCHECGARATAGDRFCRTCGSRLRAG
ncbi:MAG: zinc ribbon domain-containing protein [Anaerolineales bacterium]|nr:zinc ribbon domain-containing protein [Anaerolineales bacterium]